MDVFLEKYKKELGNLPKSRTKLIYINTQEDTDYDTVVEKINRVHKSYGNEKIKRMENHRRMKEILESHEKSSIQPPSPIQPPIQPVKHLIQPFQPLIQPVKPPQSPVKPLIKPPQSPVKPHIQYIDRKNENDVTYYQANRPRVVLEPPLYIHKPVVHKSPLYIHKPVVIPPKKVCYTAEIKKKKPIQNAEGVCDVYNIRWNKDLDNRLKKIGWSPEMIKDAMCKRINLIMLKKYTVATSRYFKMECPLLKRDRLVDSNIEKIYQLLYSEIIKWERNFQRQRYCSCNKLCDIIINGE